LFANQIKNSGNLKRRACYNLRLDRDRRFARVDPDADHLRLQIFWIIAKCSLPQCLNSLFEQTYTNFEIHFVFDDKLDPGLQTVDDFLKQNSNSDIRTTKHFLSHEISKSCSLKNQAVLIAISQANDSVEIFALVDADGVVEPDWLAELVKPLDEEKVGASTGSRWFAPSNRNMGSLVRQVWNAASLPQMDLYNIAWGGSLAIKRTTIETCNLLDHWSEAFCEDTLLTRVLRENNLSLARASKVIVENKESTELGPALNWISRQLLTVRLHHKSWPLVLAHAIFSGACLIAVPIAILLCLLSQQYFVLVYLIAVILFLLFGNLIQIQVIQFAIKGAFQNPAEVKTGARPKFKKGPSLIPVLLTQLLYPIIALKTAFKKQVSWRGIEYKIKPGKKIEMVEYRPYRQCNAPESQNASID